MAPGELDQRQAQVVLDEHLAAAVELVARRLSVIGATGAAMSRSSFIEELAGALGRDWRLGPERRQQQEREAQLFSFTRPLYGPRIVRRDGSDSGTVGAAFVEAGWAVGRSNFDHLLFDALDIVDASRHPEFIAGYLVAAAPRGRWNAPEMGADWFAPEPGTIRRVNLVASHIEHRSGWRDLGEELHRRVEAVPRTIESVSIAAHPFRMRERTGGMKRCSVRCVRIRPSLQDAAPA